jgi:glyoxylase-like metal-dependent hydrolase (beta-lactamase superfamily II)
MNELIKTGERTYYINAPVKVGVYLDRDAGAYLVDSGNDKEAGRRIRKILDEKGWQLKGIINTHSNADHIGGNRYLQKETGCSIWAAGMEADFIRHTVLEPAFLYGAFPCKDLRHKFLMAAESSVKDISSGGLPQGLEIIDLPGHFFNMIGVKTPDGTAFIADSLCSAGTLEKYKIGFVYDVEKYLETLAFLKGFEAELFVPAHAEAVKDIKPLAELNRKTVMEIAEKILEICAVPSSFESILKTLFSVYGLSMNFEQYVLAGSTVRSYLSWLKDTLKLDITFKDNMMLWRRV